MLATVSNDYERLLIGLFQRYHVFYGAEGSSLYNTAMKRYLTSPPHLSHAICRHHLGIWDFFLPTPCSICPSYDHLINASSPRIRPQINGYIGSSRENKSGVPSREALLWGRISCWKEQLLEDSESQYGFGHLKSGVSKKRLIDSANSRVHR